MKTESNTADDASRRLWFDALSSVSSWINGPDFFWKFEEEWPKRPENSNKVANDDPEVKQEVTVSIVLIKESANTTNKLISHFSSWISLKKTSWILKVTRETLRRLCKSRQELREEFSKAESNPIQKRRWSHSKCREGKYILLQNVDWIFNPPAGSHHGGV